MSRDSNEQRYQYETLPMPRAFPPPLPKPYRATWQYPPTDTPPFPHSILSLTASTAVPGSLSPFTIHDLPGPYRKYLNSNVNVKPIEAALCTWATPSIPASTSTYGDQAQRGIALVNVKTSPSSAGFSLGRDEDINKRDVLNVKGNRRAPQITSEPVLSSAETASSAPGSPPSLSQSSPTGESVTGSPTSLSSSSILTLTTVPVPGSSVPSTPLTFTSTLTTVTSITTTTAFPLTSAPANPSTPANGVTSPKLTSTPSPTTRTTTTTISNSPDPESLSTSTSTSTSRTMSFQSSATSIPASSPIIISPTSPFTTSISGLPTSLTFTTRPSASIPFSSITTSDSVTITDITSFASLSSTFTSSFITTPSSSISPSSPDSEPLAQSSTYTPPSMIFSSSNTDRIWSTTTTKVFTSTLRDGGVTVVTTVIQSGVLSTNSSLSGNRFSGNTGAVIAVAVCATVGVIIFVFVAFFLCKRYRERKEREKRRKSRRPSLRFPAVPVSGRPGTGDSGGSGRVDSRANILATGYGRWSRSRSGEAVMERGAGPSEDGEDEEDVWRSPLVGEDDDIGMGMGGLTTPPEPPENGEGKPVGGRKSSIGHQSGHSHSLGHSLAHSQSSSGHHGQGQGVSPSMAEFGVGPVSYAAYAYPPALVGSAYHSGVAAGSGGGEGSGAPGEGEGYSGGLHSYGSRASYGAFVPYGANGPMVPTPSQVAVSGVGTGCHVLPPTNGVETKDKPGQRPGSGRQGSEGEASSVSGGHAAAISASAITATAADASGMPTTGTSESRRTSGSKGSLRSIGSKSLRGLMDRIRTSVPNIQVTDGVLSTRRSSKDMSSPSSASGSGGETRPGYDYGVVGRPRRASSGVHAPPPVAFVYPGFHITPPGAPGTDVPNDFPSNPQVDISNHYHGPTLYGYPVPAVNGEGERSVDEDEDDSLRITNGVVTHGLLDPNINLIAGGSEDGGSAGGRSSPNVEGASLRDYVDYSRRIGGMVKNHVTRSTTTFDTVDQDGSIHFFPSGGRPPTSG